jgi:hypothetical protein
MLFGALGLMKDPLLREFLGLLAVSGAAGEQSGAGGVLEDLADTLVCLGRAFEVLVAANLLADLLALERMNDMLAKCPASYQLQGVADPR